MCMNVHVWDVTYVFSSPYGGGHSHPHVCAYIIQKYSRLNLYTPSEFQSLLELTTANRLSWPYKPCLASSVRQVK